MPHTNKKLLVLDIEGTIFKASSGQVEGVDYASTMWQPIAHALGAEAVEEERVLATKWDNNEFERYSDWVAATVEMHKERGLDKSTFDALLDKAEYEEGVVDFFKNLDREKYTPVLLSGGFQELANRAMHDLNIKYGFGACRYNFDKDGKLTSFSLKFSDYEGKISFVEQHTEQLNLDYYSDWLFVGDGKNDRFIADAAPIAFAINGHPDLLAVKGVKPIKNFYELSELIANLEEKDFHKKINSLLINPSQLHILSKIHGYIYACTALYQAWLNNSLSPRLQYYLINDEYERQKEESKHVKHPMSIGAADLLFLLNASLHTKRGDIQDILRSRYDAYRDTIDVGKKERRKVARLLEKTRDVRNKWSHIQYESFPEVKTIQRHLNTLIHFMACFGEKNAAADIIREIELWSKSLK